MCFFMHLSCPCEEIDRKMRARFVFLLYVTYLPRELSALHGLDPEPRTNPYTDE